MAPDSHAAETTEAQPVQAEPLIMRTTLAGKATCIFLALAVLWLLFGVWGCVFAQAVSGGNLIAIGDVCAALLGFVVLVGFLVFLIHTLTLRIEVGTDSITTKSALFACKRIHKSDIRLARHANGEVEWILIWTSRPPNKSFMPRLNIPISFLSKDNAQKVIDFVKEPLAQQAKIDEAKAEKEGIAFAAGYIVILYLIFFAALAYAIYKYYLPAAPP